MPPRAPGTLSNGTLSLKFMQRGLAADQKPVEAEKARLVDDSHWEIAHPPEKKVLLNTERQKGFDVTYEASYIPFLYGPDSSVSDNAPGSSSASLISVAVNGRRTFRGGQEVQTQSEAPANPQEGQEGDLRYSSPAASEEIGDELPRGNGSSSSQAPAQEERARPSPSVRKDVNLLRSTYTGDGKPQFLRPADVDVPVRITGAYPIGGKGKSKRDTLSEMIASAKSSQNTTGSSSASTSANDQPTLRRKASEENEESRPRKKPKRNKGAPNP